MKRFRQHLKEFIHPTVNSKGIPREQMPQIRVDLQGDFIRHLMRQGHHIKGEYITPDRLKPTQSEMSFVKIITKAHSIENGREPKPIFVSNDNYILDGHHEWAGALKAAPGKEMLVYRVDMDIDELLMQAHSFPKSEYKDVADRPIGEHQLKSFKAFGKE